MPSFNRVIIAGNLTRDPELRYTQSGLAVAELNLAINRKWRTQDGQDREEVTYVEVTTFKRQAETLCQHLGKGSPILVEGRLKLDQWDDQKTGQKRSKLGVVMESFQFLESGGQRQSQGQSNPPPRATQPSQATADDSDVPF